MGHCEGTTLPTDRSVTSASTKGLSVSLLATIYQFYCRGSVNQAVKPRSTIYQFYCRRSVNQAVKPRSAHREAPTTTTKCYACHVSCAPSLRVHPPPPPVAPSPPPPPSQHSPEMRTICLTSDNVSASPSRAGSGRCGTVEEPGCDARIAR